jgi:hypothetical protein
MAADRADQQEVLQEAEMMTQASREYEARKMDQTISALNPKMAAAQVIVGDMLKVAAIVVTADGDAEKMAYLLDLHGIDKESGIGGQLLGGLARAGGAALKGLGGAASAAGRLLPAAESAATKAPLLQRASGWLNAKGANMAQKGVAMAAAGPAAVAAAPAAAAANGGKPLLSGMTKAKLLGGGAVLGAGYLGMKGLQAGRDYMLQPSGTHEGPPIQNNVGREGYPVY